MSKNNSNNKKMLKMQELQELQQQFEGIESENSKLTSVIGKIKQEINWYSTYLNKCKKENPTTFNRVINGTFDGSEGINMIDLELHSTGNKQKKISKRNLGPVKSVLGTAETKKTGYKNVGLANGFDDIGIDLDFLEGPENKQPAFDNDIIVDDLYFDAGALPTNSQNAGINSSFKLDGLLSNSNSNLNLTQLGLPTPNTNSSILQQVQQYQYQEQNALLAQQNLPGKTSMNKDEMMLMKSLKDALNNI